ncbi:MAG: PorT family protein, partial [Pedobacter sp.]
MKKLNLAKFLIFDLNKKNKTMKKIIVSVLTIFTFGLTHAQEIDYGVKGGLNIANLTGDIENAKSKVSLHVGGFVQFKVNEKFSVQPELLYSQQG